MVLSLAFLLFLVVPLMLLAGSVVKTAISAAGPEEAKAAKRNKADAPMVVGSALLAPPPKRLRMPRRHRDDVTVDAAERDLASEALLANRPMVPAAPAVSRPIGLASQASADVLRFRTRETELAYQQRELEAAGTGA